MASFQVVSEQANENAGQGPSGEDLRKALATFPTGIAIVTTFAGEEPIGATANAVTGLSLDPPLILACLDRRSRTLEAIKASERFGVNGLAAEHVGLARSFSDPATRETRWDDLDWSESLGSPRLGQMPLWVGCSLHDLVEGGDHLIVIGAVEEIEGRDADPLIFHGGDYHGLR
jgi:flavin reductase (DIM6/NTAB) family NADH-FMN oxidoreductase RutF